MQLLDIIILLKMLATHPLSGVGKLLNKLSVRKIKKLRIKSVLAIRIALWLLPNECTINYPAPRPIRSPSELLSKTIDHTPETDIYLRNICRSINDWDVYDRYTHESLISTARMHGATTDVVDNMPFIITVKMAYALNSMYISTSELIYLEYYLKLLDGIDKTMIDEHGKPVINCVSGSGLSVFAHGEGVPAISSLLLLISCFNNIDDMLCTNLESSILERYIMTTTENDYLILGGNSVYCDLKPNATTSMCKCFIYIATRLLDSNLTIKDMSIFMLYLNIHPHDGVCADEADIIHTFSVLEGILNIYESKAPKIITKQYPIVSIANRCLALATYIRSNRKYYNPEFDSIIFKLKLISNNTPGISKTVCRILGIINVMFDNNAIYKTVNLRRSLYNKTDMDISYIDPNTPLPPLYRPNIPYYWFHTPVEDTPDVLEAPMFEYFIIYSKIYDYMWNRLY